MTNFVRCTICEWIEESDDPKHCKRCRARVRPLSDDEVVTLVDMGEIVFCNACQHSHSGALLPVIVKGEGTAETDS